jgi:multidrug efflux pump subunit AcrA (membrane-fusion protein)
MSPSLRYLALAALVGALASCRPAEVAPPPAAEQGPVAPPGSIDIPAPVRRNLGITFVTVAQREVAATLRVPGRFELLPTARREYRAPVAGRVEPLVAQFDSVEPGTVLYRLDAPAWRSLQQEIVAAQSALSQARARLESMAPLREAHRRHEQSLGDKVAIWRDRLVQLDRLREAGGGNAQQRTEAQATLNATEAELADVMEKDAELASRERELIAEVEGGALRQEVLLAGAAALSGLSIAELREVVEVGGNRGPRWQVLPAIEVRATAAGRVEAIDVTPGAQVAEGGIIASTIEPRRIRFRGHALQTDLSRLCDGLPARVVAAQGSGVSIGAAIPGELTVGLIADPTERSIDLVLLPPPGDLPNWAKAGVAAFLEITIDGGGSELAVPLSAVARDGGRPVLFRRDPANPDRAVRLDADLGRDDGRWVEVLSGLRDGDEVVVDGAYQLMLATAGNAPKGGHFHSDGTFHAEDH